MINHRSINANRMEGVSLVVLLILLTGLLGATEVFAYGRFTIDSRPQGARVMVGGAYYGRTPLDLSLGVGHWQIELQKHGYAPLKESVRVRPGRSRDLRLDLQPLERKGFLDIASMPSPAKIFLNDVAYDRTPRRLSLRPGVYNLRLEKKGYRAFKDQIRITTNHTLRLQPKLDPKVAYGTVTITSNPSGARVLVRGRYYDVTPTRLQLWRGEYQVKLEKDGFHSQIHTVRVGPRQTNRVAVDLLPVERFGMLRIKTNPDGARVFIDGQFVDKTPINSRLKTGRHEITIRKKGFVPITVNEMVQADTRTVRSYILNPRRPPRPRKGVLRVTAYPNSANVLVNDQPYGQTPLEIDLPPGKHRVVVRKHHYQPYHEEIAMGSGQLVPLRIQLVPKPREIAHGILKVLSNPNAKVFVNGRYLGVTPVNLTLLGGEYQVEVQRKGYRPYSTTVELNGGHTRSVMANLELRQPLRPRVSQVSVLSRPERAKVFVDQRYIGTAPLTFNLTEGPHWIEIKHRDFLPFQQEVEVHDGRPLQINASLQWRGGMTPHYLLHQIVKEVLKP